jgi:Flp pilus assembly protein TadG
VSPYKRYVEYIRGGGPMTSARRVAAMLGGLLTLACDPTSSMDPKDRSTSFVPDVALTVSASSSNATAASWSEIDISWPRIPSASGYQVWRSGTGSAGAYTQIATTPADVLRYADTGLTGSTQYCYEVRSFKTAGKNTTYGAFSASLCATTFAPPVVAPSQPDALPEGMNIRVSWKDNSTNEDGFRIEMAPATNGEWTQVSSVGANVTTTFGSWEVAEHQACLRVIAYNSIGPSTPSTPDCTTVPAPPTNLSAKALDAQSITLTWADNSAVEDGYKVSRAQAGGDWVDLGTVGTNVVSYRDATVTANTSYTYRVEAAKDGGYSVASNEVGAVLATTVPASPSGAWAYFEGQTDYGASSYLALEWMDASSNEEGFRIEYSADTLTGWSLYSQTGPNVTSYQEKFFFAGPAGCFRIIAFNNVGLSRPSNVTCGEMRGAPTDLVATALDQQTIDLTWTDNAGYESGFEIVRTTSDDSNTWSVVADVPPNTTSYRDSGLESGKQYTYYVYVEYNTADVCCGSSNYAVATTPSGGVAPSASVRSSPAPIGRAAPTRRTRINRRPTRRIFPMLHTPR